VEALKKLNLEDIRSTLPDVHFSDRLSKIQHNGMDLGGLTKTWFHQLGEELGKVGAWFGYLKSSASENQGHFFIHPLADFVQESDEYFWVLGRMLAISLINPDLGLTLPINLSKSMYALLLGHPLTAKDYQEIDPTFYNSVKMLDEDQSIEYLSLVMSVSMETPQDLNKQNLPHWLKVQGNLTTAELIEDGENVNVENHNFNQYMIGRARFFCGQKTQRCLKTLIQSFREICPVDLTTHLNSEIISELIEGNPIISLAEWRQNAVIDYTACEGKKKQADLVIKFFLGFP
jgi:hypothetical protein